MINTILTICLGNICRSPMAEGLLKSALPHKKVFSAGITAMVGQSADPFAVQLMQEAGIDISGHRGQSLMGWMVTESDLILTMDQEQKRYLEQRYSAAKGKVLRLGEFGGYDIDDPYKRGLEAFRQSYNLIAQGVDDLAQKIKRMDG